MSSIEHKDARDRPSRSCARTSWRGTTRSCGRRSREAGARLEAVVCVHGDEHPELPGRSAKRTISCSERFPTGVYNASVSAPGENRDSLETVESRRHRTPVLARCSEEWIGEQTHAGAHGSSRGDISVELPVSRGSRSRQVKRWSEMGTYLHSKPGVSA